MVDGTHSTEELPEEPIQPPAAATRRPVPRLVRVLVGVAVCVVLLSVMTDYVTSVPQLCGSCHEIAPRYASWAKSPHAGVSCVQCHQPATRWYQVPARLAGRTRLLLHDVGTHLSGDYEDPVERRVAGKPSVADESCLQCHDPKRKTTSGLRILINHAEHAKRNKSCVSCHVRVAHPITTRGNALSFMGQCFTCHGNQKGAKAPGTCSLCHPKEYELLPASHKAKTWKGIHGETFDRDPKLCLMCHTRKSCADCHGLEMPHPEGWGERTGHPQVAQLNRGVCTQCHGSSPDMCTMCHHEDYVPSQGGWIRQHNVSVRARGAASCVDCHSPTHCIGCHVREGGPPSPR